MHYSLRYFPVFAVFGVSLGCFFSLLVRPGTRVFDVLTAVFSLLIPFLYQGELVARLILQAWYPFSTLGTAAENHLSDYLPVVLRTIFFNLPILLLMVLPSALYLLFYDRAAQRVDWRRALILGFILHFMGYGLICLPWKGDLTPHDLYHMDTNLDDQVEQLGLHNMFRRDVWHAVFPVTEAVPEFEPVEPIPDKTGKEEPGGAEAPGGDAGGDGPAAEEPVEEPVPEIDTSPNVLDVDLAALAESTGDKNVKWLAQYFDSAVPTNKNEYTGMLRGYNVIFLTLEGMSGYAIDEKITPTLYRMTHEGVRLNNYYTALHFTSTSNGECQHLLGLYPKNGSPISMKRTGILKTNCYFSLAQQLKRAGYRTIGYHNNLDMYGRAASHSNLGYDWRYYKHGLDVEENSSHTKVVWPPRDTYMIDVSTPDYLDSGDTSPFHVYYLTISGHTPYSWNFATRPYREELEAMGLPYSEKTMGYLGTAVEVDRAMQLLLERLEEAGVLDHTLIVASPDHIPYADVEILEELAGRKFGTSEALENINESDIDFDVYKSMAIIWSPAFRETIEVDKVCCQVDLLPTISNLLGLDYDSRMLAGSDILSDSEGLVVFSSRSWKSDRGFYNRFSQTFTPAPGVEMTEEEQSAYVESMKKLVSYKLDMTNRIIESDFYDKVFGK